MTAGQTELREPENRAAPASQHPVSEAYARHVNPSFMRLLGLLGYGRVFTRARDVWIWDHTGRRYLDCLAGFGAVNIGHNHPELIRHLHEVLDGEHLHFCHLGPATQAAELAKALIARLQAPLEICLFANGGAEAVEAGLKLARIATGRTAFLACDGGFHGTSLGTLGLMGAERLREPFQPLLPDCHRIAFGQLDELEQALRRWQPAAFLVEPIQAEGGIVLPPIGYLAAAQALCRQYGCLLILDEIQTGLGRTGSWFAYEGEGLVPDVLCLAKPLSGGMMPISVAVTSRALFDRAYGKTDRFDWHSSTFQGNALSTSTALKTLHIIGQQDLVARSAAAGERMLTGLRQRLSGHPLIADIRGRGLLIGIEFGPTGQGWLDKLAPGLVGKLTETMFGQWVALKMLEAGVLCQPSASCWNVLRLEPPLTIADAEIDFVVETLGTVLDEYRRLMPAVVDLGGRVLKQWRGGWQF